MPDTRTACGCELSWPEVDTNHTVYANRRGITNQWHFFTFTNAYEEDNDDDIDMTDPDDDSGDDVDKPDFGQYVAFITFMPPNLSTPRRWLDVDLYVRSTDGSGPGHCWTRCSRSTDRWFKYLHV